MSPLEVVMCDVCDSSPATGGGLTCTHRFCPDCFARYVSGSLAYLDQSLRCCVCGRISDLIGEISVPMMTSPSGDRRPAACPLVTFGRQGDAKLVRPCGMARRPNGHLVIGERTTNRVHVFDRNGRPVLDFAFTYRSDPARGLAITADGLIAIPSRDTRYDYVGYYSPDGAFVGSAFVTLPAGGAERADLRGAVCDHVTDRLYVTDRNNTCVVVVDNSAKVQRGRITLERSIPSELRPDPFGICLSPEGDLYVTDVANHCVRIYTTCGLFTKKFGCYGNRPGQFDRPTGIALTSDGHVVVADRGNQRVQELDQDGHFIRYVVCFRSGYDVYMAPDDVIVSPDGHVTVLMTSVQSMEVAEVRIYE